MARLATRVVGTVDGCPLLFSRAMTRPFGRELDLGREYGCWRELDLGREYGCWACGLSRRRSRKFRHPRRSAELAAGELRPLGDESTAACWNPRRSIQRRRLRYV